MDDSRHDTNEDVSMCRWVVQGSSIGGGLTDALMDALTVGWQKIVFSLRFSQCHAPLRSLCCSEMDAPFLA